MQPGSVALFHIVGKVIELFAQMLKLSVGDEVDQCIFDRLDRIAHSLASHEGELTETVPFAEAVVKFSTASADLYSPAADKI